MKTIFSSLLNAAFEPRTLTRWDVHKYARKAYDMGVRYIGGCCGFQPYHIRAIAEEVSEVGSQTDRMYTSMSEWPAIWLYGILELENSKLESV